MPKSISPLNWATTWIASLSCPPACASASKSSQNVFGGLASGADAVGNPDAVIRVAGQVKAGDCGGAGADFRDAWRVTHVVLSHGARPARDDVFDGSGCQAEDAAQLLARDGDQGFVGFTERRFVARATQEAPQGDAIFRHAMGKFGAYERARGQPPALLARNQEPEAGVT